MYQVKVWYFFPSISTPFVCLSLLPFSSRMAKHRLKVVERDPSKPNILSTVISLVCHSTVSIIGSSISHFHTSGFVDATFRRYTHDRSMRLRKSRLYPKQRELWFEDTKPSLAYTAYVVAWPAKLEPVHACCNSTRLSTPLLPPPLIKQQVHIIATIFKLFSQSLINFPCGINVLLHLAFIMEIWTYSI